jgi:hypothetical protein
MIETSPTLVEAHPAMRRYFVERRRLLIREANALSHMLGLPVYAPRGEEREAEVDAPAECGQDG